MEVVAQLIDKYGVSLGILVWMFYRDYRFLTKLESWMDRLANHVKGDTTI